MKDTDVIRFCFELGHLRQIKHEGWRLAGVREPESIAEHSLRAAQLAFILAHLEGHENPAEIVTMLVFHDMGEIRVGDVHKLANRYVHVDEAQAVLDQTVPLGALGENIKALWQTVESGTSKAAMIARDADRLEQAFMAKELIEVGYAECAEWITAIKGLLQTESARRLIDGLEDQKAYQWWAGLKKQSVNPVAEDQ
jgi:putative hydrolase of HD superfamily